jgi:dTDP-4-amino-4,6-dideoxygalactose transaminase
MKQVRIPFNRPCFLGTEISNITEAVKLAHISGNGYFTRRCQEWFRERAGFTYNLLTTSCTDALEMAALLLDIKPGDEVILPSFTFVSTANPFVLRGAKLVFADSCEDHPNMDAGKLEGLITSRTKAIVPVHYAGMACDMDAILEIARRHELHVVEDAAQAFNAFYKGQPLGSLGDFGTMSFHETKNITCGEGGLLIVNNESWMRRAEIIWEKGTNRSAFFRGEVDKYRWVDIGSSFLPSDILAAVLFAQLEHSEEIQSLRAAAWQRYLEGLVTLEQRGLVRLPAIPAGATNNAHIFYLVCAKGSQRDALLEHLKGQGISAVIHYQALHRSPYYAARHADRELRQADRYADCLLRLPLFCEITPEQQDRVCSAVQSFYDASD